VTNTNTRKFLAGFLVTIFALTSLGRLTLELAQFPSLKRFWVMQSPGTNFFPTIRQQHVWVKQQATIDQTIVILGGSSFLLGNGQPVELSTGVVLQKKLGPNFKVVNLAVQGGGAFGQGLYVASKLRSEGYKVIFISDINPGYAPPFENDTPYAYSYWQARFAGFLKNSPEDQSDFTSVSFNYKSVLALLNQYLYFQELANYISYNYVKINNSPYSGLPNFTPLGKWKDEEKVIPFEERHKNIAIEEAYFKQAYAYADRFYITESTYREVAQKYFEGITAANSPKTILVACGSNPRYLAPLDKELLKNYYSIINNQIKALNRKGLEAYSACDGFSQEDFGDITHLVPSGAEKLASKLARWINEK